LQERLERSPRPLEVEWDYSLHFGALIKPNQSAWKNQLTIPTSTLANQCEVQSDSKKKCLIMKNLWTMSFLDLERIDANDSILWVLWGSVYIEKGDKCKILAKNNIVNRFTKCVNRFRQLKDKQDDNEDWYASESIQMFPDEDWYDSKSYESIQPKSESFHDTIQHNLNRFRHGKGKFDVVNIWVDSVKLWIDSLWYYSGKFDSIQKEWHKENGQKECLIWINESWTE